VETGQAFTVGAVFGVKKKIKPVWFIWQAREYRIKDITYIWNRREGISLLYLFSVTDTADNLYELSYQTDTAALTLLARAEDT
jgi:hypothetical protein